MVGCRLCVESSFFSFTSSSADASSLSGVHFKNIFLLIIMRTFASLWEEDRCAEISSYEIIWSSTNVSDTDFDRVDWFLMKLLIEMNDRWTAIISGIMWPKFGNDLEIVSLSYLNCYFDDDGLNIKLLNNLDWSKSEGLQEVKIKKKRLSRKSSTSPLNSPS